MGERRTTTWKAGGRVLLAGAAVLLALGVVPQTATAEPDPPSFPGAEGFGAGATGGRGGSVYVVDTLEPTGEGSLGDALAPEECEPRTVVFAVSGVIEVPGDHGLDLTCGDLTIAGQTAPGGGITVAGRIDGYGAEPPGNIIMRHVRLRPPPITDEEGVEDELGQRYDALQLSNNPNLMLDHLSMSWGSDETFDIYENSGDATIQWSTIEQSNPAGLGDEGPHNDGMIAGPDSPRVTVNGVLFAHHEARCPALATGPIELVNNVMYDCQDAFVHHNPAEGEFHVAANTFIHGPSSEEHTPIFLDDEEEGDSTYWFSNNEFIDETGFTGVVEGDISETELAESAFYAADPSQVIAEPSDFAEESEDYQPTTIQESPGAAYDLVLAQSGAFPRDWMTLETVEDVETGGGDWEPDPPEDLFAGLEATDPPADEDADGMADEWEEANGLDPSDPDDHATEQDGGYTAIEVYVNELADELVGAAPAAAPDGDGGDESEGGGGGGSSEEASTPSSGGDDGTDPILFVILGVSVVALVLAGLALYTVRRRPAAAPPSTGTPPEAAPPDAPRGTSF